MGRKKAEISGTKNERLPIKTAGNKGFASGGLKCKIEH